MYFYKLLCIYPNHLPLFRLKMVKKYQTRALQQVMNSVDNDDLFDHEMTTYYTLLDRRNRVSSTDIIIANPT